MSEAVTDKVRKLLAKAEATDNPNEAEAFSAKAAQLIAAHRIDPSRLAGEHATGERLGVRHVPVGRGAYVRARLALLGAVAAVNDCELVWRSGPDGATALLAGFESDLDATLVLHESLHLQAAGQLASVRRATPAATQRWRRAFLFGFATRIGELLAEARQRAEADARATGTSLPDLVSRSARVREHAASTFGRVVAASTPSPAVAGGWDRGRRAASGADIGRVRLAGRRAIGPGAMTTEAVYAAEEAAFGGTEFDDELAMDDVVATLTGGEWWRSCAVPAIEVRRARSGSSTSSARCAPDGCVVIRIATTSASTVSHELAHALAGVDLGHDATFRAAHVDVVAALAGADIAASLERAYADFGVAAGVRRWPQPVRASGPGFVMV